MIMARTIFHCFFWWDSLLLYVQIDNTDYINSDVPSDEDIISEEEIQNGTGYELEEEADDDAFSAL